MKPTDAIERILKITEAGIEEFYHESRPKRTKSKRQRSRNGKTILKRLSIDLPEDWMFPPKTRQEIRSYLESQPVAIIITLFGLTRVTLLSWEPADFLELYGSASAMFKNRAETIEQMVSTSALPGYLCYAFNYLADKGIDIDEHFRD